MGTYKVNDIKGIVRDSGFGKHPDGTFNSLVNFDADYEQGSLVSRSGYATHISPPSGIASPKWMLSAPINYPTATDMFLLYDNDNNKNTYLYPYWHNSSTATNGWVDVQEYFDVDEFSSSGVQLTIIDPSSGHTANKYKNWVFIQNSSEKIYFVKSNTSGGVLTLDRTAPDPTIDSSGRLVRYYHDKDSGFFSTYTTPTNPACYSSDLAIRWSLGSSSNSYHKNMWAGYINRTFFSSDTDDKYLYQGTYITEAECKAPTTSDLGTPSPSLTSSDLGSSQIPNPHDRSFETSTATNWAASGSSASVNILKAELNITQNFTDETGKTIPITRNYKTLKVGFNGTGDTNRLSLSSAYFSQLTSSVVYRISAQYYNPTGNTIVLSFVMGGQTIPISIAPSENNGLSDIDITFTSTAAHTSLYIYSDTIATIYLSYINIQSSQTYKGLDSDTTFTLFGSFVYDGFQESEFIKLSELYQTAPKQKLTYELKIDFASLNKRITGIRTYLDVAKGNTTINSNRNFTKYLLSDISIADNDTNWAFDSATSKYKYTDTIDANKLDVAKYNLTWEQKTNRIASNSTTCSYDISKSVAGRIFVAREYDYYDAKEYTQRVRYTGFNGDGVMCPDIFPNITDRNITYISTGTGVKINALSELNGSLIVVKEGSIVELTTSDLVELWRLKVVDNNFSSLGKNSVLSTEQGMIFGGTDDMIIWRGGDTQSIIEGVWKNLYQSEVDSSNPDGFFITKKKNNGNIIVYPDTMPSGENTSYEFNLKKFIPISNQYAIGFYSISQLKDNNNIGMISNGSLVKFSNASTGDNSSISSVAIQPSFLTNKILPDSKYNVSVSEIFLTIEGNGTINGSSSFKLIGDGSTIQTYTIDGSDLSNKIKFYRFKVQTHKPVKYVQLELVAGLDASSANGLKIHEYGFEYETKKESGDVSYA